MSLYDELLKEINTEKENETKCSKPYVYGYVPRKVAAALDDIELNRNHSLAVELFERNKEHMEKPALLYRGNEISYKEMFEKAFTYAKSLKEMGYNKGDEIPMCITNTPEFVYLFLATSFIGATANIVGEWFDKDYLKEILNNTKSKNIFIDDISYSAIKDSINESEIENIVCFSLTDSLKDKSGKKVNPHSIIDDMFVPIENHIEEIKKDYKGNVIDVKSFEEIGKNYTGKVVENVDLNDLCSITYTSGTTSPGHPKGVKQSNRSYITLSRFKESDVSGMPTMKNMKILGHIPTYTHMELSCALSDTLYCNCTLALEPFYNKDFFPYSLIINKPNFVPASAGFWGNLCKLLEFDDAWKDVNLPFLMIPTVTGEACSIGEEKFFNATSRKHKFGTEKLPFPLAPVTFSIGGGTTESSGIFVTLFKALQEKKLNHLIRKESLGLTPHKFAEIDVLDEKGNSCKINEPGRLVANSPCEMIGYTDDELNKHTHVQDANGKTWLDLTTYSYKDRTGRIKMKGRMNSYLTLSDGSKVPYYLIEDSVLKDTKNVMSCSTVSDEENNLICHIEFQPHKRKSEDVARKSVIERIDSDFNDEVKDKLYIRFRDNKESFPLDPSGKRSTSTLKRVGIDEKTVSFNDLKKKYLKEDAKMLKKVRS